MDFLDGKSILITGGTGSFGKKIVNYLLNHRRTKKVIVFSRDELKQFEMSQEYNDSRLRFFLGDVRDKKRLDRAFANVDYVIHAAALKQVPACEYNPFEAIKTNILGAQNIIEAAIDCGVQKVIALSTDKAANPVNLYGATKLCSDKLFVAGNSYVGTTAETKFSVVRYGNVMGSRGSVIPLFEKQRETGVITLTDSRMTRFWITLEQGVKYVLNSLTYMHGGEVFVPKIPSMRIVDLAEAIAPGCRHEYIGVRTGEKLHEIMIPEDDARHTIELDNFYIIKPQFSWWNDELWPAAKTVPEGFIYSSDANSEWLTKEELIEKLGD
ncbi:MAG: UDP-N-acetylglucosamine 4,6-dehydratase (inverting) [Desulfosporosinus sp.]